MATTDIGSGSVQGLLAFMDFMIDKGYGTAAAIMPWKSAAKQVFEKVEGDEYERADARSFDIDEYLERFENRSMGSYSADSLRAYRGRFRRAVESYRSYLADPNWRPVMRRVARPANSESATRIRGGKSTPAKVNAPVDPAAVSPPSASLIAYPFPLKSGQIAQLNLPTNLEREDAERLIQFIRALVFQPATTESFSH